MSCPHYLKMPLISKYILSELSHFITKDNCIRLKNERYCQILDPKNLTFKMYSLMMCEVFKVLMVVYK